MFCHQKVIGSQSKSAELQFIDAKKQALKRDGGKDKCIKMFANFFVNFMLSTEGVFLVLVTCSGFLFQISDSGSAIKNCNVELAV
jgi:hypothetical protein